MDGYLRDDGVVRVDGDARQRFYDSRGYGRPGEGNTVFLAPVEAAHLLFRDDLDSVEGMGFREFLTRTGAVLSFVVYRDLRERGFYLSPAREGWVDDPEGTDFVVYPRGKGPWDDETLYRVRVVGERASVPASELGGDADAIAVVDEDGELTYFETENVEVGGTADYHPGRELDADLLSDRVLLWDAPDEVYREAFYGQRLYGRNAEEGPLQLSLIEAAYLADCGGLSLDAADVRARGRQVEGERFDRRLRVYAALRDAGSVPKSGFKFGADFRTYDEFDGVDDLGHSNRLVRAVADDHEFVPRDLSLDVRLAGGVRKRMVFARTGASDDDAIDWLSVDRLTP